MLISSCITARWLLSMAELPFTLAPQSIYVWGDSPWAVGIRFTPPANTSGIVLFRGSAGGSTCDVSINAGDTFCLMMRLDGATRYKVEGVSCDENGLCSSPVVGSAVTYPDRELKLFFFHVITHKC